MTEFFTSPTLGFTQHSDEVNADPNFVWVSRFSESTMAPQETVSVKHPGIRLSVNGKYYDVGSDIPPWTTLVDFIREQVHLPGTKYLCREGGCGVCTLVATIPDLESEGGTKTISVRACQSLVYNCAGWSIETIENLGNRHIGYHSLEKALTGFYGTQCGYCSPGMVMTMYGELKSSGALTSDQVENALDGNLCRCTGYRPILDAFKSLAVDAPEHLKNKLADIEDAYKVKCPNSGELCRGTCSKKETNGYNHPGNGCSSFGNEPSDDLEVKAGGVTWYQPATLSGVYRILKQLDSKYKIRLVVGNTGQGVYKDDGPYNVYISTTGIKDFYTVEKSGSLKLGANVSLSRAIKVMESVALSTPGYQHLKNIADHWKKVANVAIRNVGSWAGNLMLKHAHPEFPSDIWLTLLGADCKVSLGDSTTSSTDEVDLRQFLKEDMARKVILNISFPPFMEDTYFYTYKITPRAVNAHAYINACIKMKVDVKNNFNIVESPTILFGGIHPEFINASKTEAYLSNKSLLDDQTINGALMVLGNEVIPEVQPQDASPQYRTSLTQALLYKTVVQILGDKVDGDFRSAGMGLERPLSSGRQDFDMNKDSWPVGEPIPKIESAAQVSGEAEYLNDVPYLPDEAHGAYVLSQYARANIKSVDATKALFIPGVIDFVTAEDIPGVNSFVAQAGPYPDPVFAKGEVRYAGQPIGMIVATSRDVAVTAAKIVKVEYENIQKPVLTIEEGLITGNCEAAQDYITREPVEWTLGDFNGAFNESKNKLVGQLEQGTQFHFSMEPLAARAVPIEDGYDIFCTTQWPTETQSTVANVLNIPAHSINISVRRLGGGYGGKISRQHIVSSAAAVAAHKLKRPVRINLDLTTHMSVAGWREAFLSKYEVGFDNNGRLEALKIDIFCDIGHVNNEPSVAFLASALQNCYSVPNFIAKPMAVTTDTAANTWCRTPGHVEALATMENIIEHIAAHLNMDPLDIRRINMVAESEKRLNGFQLQQRNVIVEDILPMLIEKARYTQRKSEIDVFNKENRWKKRGISIIPMLYEYGYPGFFKYGIQVVIYEHDGTVAISHGGIEMGQGINTKVAQVAAHILNIPLEKVTVKASNLMAGANSTVTGGSFGTDLCAHGVRVACENINKRLKPLRKEGQSWLQLVKSAHMQDEDLVERYWTAAKDHPKGYNIWGAACMEIEVDVLTGQYLVTSVDLIEDCGRSMNPYVDIGQIEGSFIMGQGLFSSEKIKWNKETGQKISNGTWEYKIPTALDIPVKMNVTMLPNATNPYGVLGSKATGEPALCLAYVFVTALRAAIASARTDAGTEGWFEMDTPLTVEKIQQLCLVDPSKFRLHNNIPAKETEMLSVNMLNNRRIFFTPMQNFPKEHPHVNFNNPQ